MRGGHGLQILRSAFFLCGQASATLIVGRPECVLSWGSFTPCGPTEPGLHAQALPEPARGSFSPANMHGIRTDVALGLLAELRAAAPADESSVWDLVSGYVEPLSILRATVTAWRDEQPTCPARTQTADNIRLLLDVDLLAASCQHVSVPRNPLLEPEPLWCKPGRAALVCGQACLTFPLATPPSTVLDPFTPRSMRVRDAVAYSSWLEAACTACANLMETAQSRPGGIFCPGIEAGLGPAADWMRAAGFRVWAHGVASPL